MPLPAGSLSNAILGPGVDHKAPPPPPSPDLESCLVATDDLSGIGQVQTRNLKITLAGRLIKSS